MCQRFHLTGDGLHTLCMHRKVVLSQGTQGAHERTLPVVNSWRILIRELLLGDAWG